MEIELLARMQFAFTIIFHYLFPPLSIGLGTMLVLMEGMYLWTKNPLYESMCKFWVKLFALNFSMGVATGIVMQFEFGTNWATFSRYIGDIFGSALAAEGIFAFFLESGFLAVLLFGWNRVSPKMHFFATIMVAFGATFSAFWICVANSWMQTPAGYEIVGTGMNAKAVITDFWAMVFNPSSISRFSHAVVGGWLTAAFFVMSVSAYYILKGRHLDFARRSFTIALVVASIAGPLQATIGHHQAKIVAQYQPAKMAAYEGHFKTGPNAPLWVIGIPDEKTGEVKWGIKLPGMLSYLLTGSVDGVVTGLDAIPENERPPIMVPFYAYHGMVALGTYMILLSWFGVILLWRKKLFESRWLMRIFVLSVAAPYLANQLGWIGCEVGRQPWIVQGLLRTSDALSKTVSADAILASLVMFIIIYALLGMVFIFSLDRKIKHGPDELHAFTPPAGSNLDGIKESHSDRLDSSKHPEAGCDGVHEGADKPHQHSEDDGSNDKKGGD